MDYGELRKELHEAIDAAIKAHIATGEDQPIIGVSGWILIAECVDLPESKSLLAISGDILGQSELPQWTARGWLAQIIEDVPYYLGDTDEEDEEEED